METSATPTGSDPSATGRTSSSGRLRQHGRCSQRHRHALRSQQRRLVSGGTDENTPDSWNFTVGNLGAAKYDALAAYSFTDPLNDRLFVDLAFIRAAASGATFLAFELNQAQPGYRLDANESDASKPFPVPTRTRGDLLVTYDVSNAGAIALGLCIWDGDQHAGRWEAFAQDLSGAPITNQPCPAVSTTLYQAALNDELSGRQGAIPAAENYLGSGQIDKGRFGEAVVNLSDALKDPSNPNGPQPCIDFGYVWMHSRSSDSLTSSQQDFVLPSNPVSIANCSVEGRKFDDANANGTNDGEPFLGGWTMFVDYNANGVLDNNKDGTFVNDMDGVVEAGEEEPYDVTSDGTGGELLGRYEITKVQSGTWPVREVLQPTWDCTAAIGGGAVAGCPERTDTNPGTALGFQLTWANNEAYGGRDFGNHRRPAQLRIIKQVSNDNGGTAAAAAWMLHVERSGSEVAGSPQAGSTMGSVYDLADGQSYDVSETGPSGYAATYSGDCDSSGAVTVAAGTEKTCTITNDDVAPVIKVVKHVVNDDGGTAGASEFTLTVNDPGDDPAGVPGDEAGTDVTVDPGAYRVSESGPSGYAATYSGDCAASVAIGETKVCTVTNDDVAPRLTIVKHVVNKGTSTAKASDFQMDVTATDPSTAHFPGSETGTTITLDAGAYAVDESGGPSTFAKTLSEDCSGTIAIGTERTCTITNTKVLPGGVVVKKGAAYAYHGDMLTFTFEVTNPGTTPLTTVTVTDDRCAPVVGPAQKLGGNDDAKLDAGETWVYTCSMGVPAHAGGDTSLVNVVTLAATDADGAPVGDTDQHTTRILHPAIAVDKTGPATAQAGQPVDYALVVSNPGDVPFLAANVSVVDPLCEAPPVLVTTNDDTTPGQLDPGDSWIYMCRVRTLVSQTQVENVGTVTGKDSFGGREVTDSDPATTSLTAPPVPQVLSAAPADTAPAPQGAVLAETAQSGTAKLTGPAKCVSGPFTVRVTGRGIAQVRFAVDGRRLKTVKAASGRTLFSVRINLRGRGTKAHRLTARVIFRAATDTSARTLRYVYVGCPKQAVLPQFTG